MGCPHSPPASGRSPARCPPPRPRAYTVTRVEGPECDADVEPDSDTAIVNYRATPRIDRSASDIVSCLGAPSKMRLLPGFRPDVLIKWLITSGDIVSGQGTPELTMQNRSPAAQVTVEGSFPDGRCSSVDRVNTVITWPGRITGFTTTPETIKAGETAQIRYIVDCNC